MLHFFDMGKSTQSTPAPMEGRMNRSEGKSLSYIPQIVKNGVVTVTIEEDDIKAQLKHSEMTLIGLVQDNNLPPKSGSTDEAGGSFDVMDDDLPTK
ncbi:hypothetical protein HAX54_004970 [Datura stramonium]|uniref:Uncharacterized protein n=1 Tax=Datura stramonium TaxID=4076 RepID=A0ABS8WXA6_DATST|nr:hypothetical protein [Datura stramonium]